MRSIVFVVCASLAVDCRRVLQDYAEPLFNVKAADEENPLATLLFALNAAKASQPNLANSGSAVFRNGAPHMQGEYKKAAEDCVNDGCRIDDVENILLQLKEEGLNYRYKQVSSLLEDVRAKQAALHDVVEELTFANPVPASAKTEFEQFGRKFFIAKPPTEVSAAMDDCDSDYYLLDEGCPILEVERVIEEMRDYAPAAKTIEKLEAAVAARKESEDSLENFLEELSHR